MTKVSSNFSSSLASIFVITYMYEADLFQSCYLMMGVKKDYPPCVYCLIDRMCVVVHNAAVNKIKDLLFISAEKKRKLTL